VDGKVNCPLMRNEEIIERPADQDTLTQRYTQEAVRIIRENRNRPFFLYLAHNMPHNPVHASAKFRGRSKGKLYGDACEEIDWGVGEIMKTLKVQGLDRNTLVIFTSDNGPNGGSAGPLRGGKTSVFEGGMRDPFIARWLGHIPTGSVCRQPASNMDMLPTLAAIAGSAAPKDRPIDGRDIRPLLFGKRKLPDYEFFYFRTLAIQALRYGNWKIHVGRGDKALAEPELYNLDLDIGEKRDVAKQYPEVVKDLQARIERFSKTLPANAKLGGSPWVF
jgi:arylsulfatase A